MVHTLHPDASVDRLNARLPGTLPGWYGMGISELAPGRLVLGMSIRPEMLAPNGFLHAASVIALADTGAGMATFAHLPDGASGFTTIELKSNFLATQTEGALRCEVSAVHTGRTTQIWDAEVIGEGGRRLALFRCTQMILWPKGA
ncbi:PaaI family thioesterase [Nitrogeniibacter mangrovi]|uniref:PaaI family thioesterase n=1 Tax=Nitrogeniibacter mangrovi TaxID=2016596 RepID=A0A6C1B2W4_9RHOO|nr:PaaI family thioesterase [Nitrogeniibacter mangrovi]QID16554.1 PaaI family thioesterase [Nitrogeniibacter mangrovi]